MLNKGFVKDKISRIMRSFKLYYPLDLLRKLASELKSFKLLSIQMSWIRPGYLEELYEIEKNN